MGMINQVILEGRFLKDPDNLKTSASNKSYISFSLAIPRGKDEQPLFVNCTAFGFDAEKVVKTGRKGSPVVLSGFLAPVISKDGKQSGMSILINSITIYPKKSDLSFAEEVPVEEDSFSLWG